MKDKTVVITGATSGLGRATALQLAQKGAFVVIIARSNTKANEVIKEIEKEGGNTMDPLVFAVAGYNLAETGRMIQIAGQPGSTSISFS